MRLGRWTARVLSAAMIVSSVSTGIELIAAPAAQALADTSVSAFGSATPYGAPGLINEPLISMAPTHTGNGYWLLGADGGVFSYGDAHFYGSTGGQVLNAPVVDIAATPSGSGYWLAAADGGVFSFGDAQFYGSMGGQTLNAPVVGIASTKDGHGYWLVAADGGVFSFGTAHFYGATPAGAGRVVDMITTPHGDGYWLVDDRGAVYPFGAAGQFGSVVDDNIALNGRVVGAIADASGLGYTLLATDGGIFAFGTAQYRGNGPPPAGQIAVAFAPANGGTGYWVASTTGLAPANPGQTSPAVLALQQRLDALGFWPGAINGYYGYDMQEAVFALQKYYGLPRTSVVDVVTASYIATAPRPRGRTTSGDAVEVDKTKQVVLVIRGGYTLAVFNTSTGSQHPFTEYGQKSKRIVSGTAVTPEGVFHVYRDVSSGWDVSDLGHLWRPKYFTGGFAVHGYPDVPPFPASHGCVRVPIDSMNEIWFRNYMPLGETVWVYH
jgi:hypothetical protein